MMTGVSSSHHDIPPDLHLVFAPIHKRVFGIAIGTAAALAIGAATTAHLLRSPADPYPLSLLAQYFYRYTVSWTGVAVGMLWGFLAGSVAGWFFAFCRNAIIAVALFLTKTRAELSATRDFLDHI